jgi:hypothetical protein
MAGAYTGTAKVRVLPPGASFTDPNERPAPPGSRFHAGSRERTLVMKEIKCSACGAVGHNKQTCPENGGGKTSAKKPRIKVTTEPSDAIVRVRIIVSVERVDG